MGEHVIGFDEEEGVEVVEMGECERVLEIHWYRGGGERDFSTRKGEKKKKKKALFKDKLSPLLFLKRRKLRRLQFYSFILVPLS